MEPICVNCSLSRRMVPGAGKPGGLVVVGEAPGVDELIQKEPFVGDSGQLLRATIAKYYDGPTYFTNSVLCRPPENRTPSKNELRCCNGRLLSEIDMARPERILLCGNSAADALLERREVGRTLQWRGIPVLHAYHPSYVLRNVFEYRDFDYQVKKLIQGPEATLKEYPYHVVRTLDEWHWVGDILRGNSTPPVIDIETSIINEFYGRFLCLGITYNGIDYIIVPGEILRQAVGYLDGLPVVCHNFQFEYTWMRRHFGIKLVCAWDTMLANYALDERSEEAKSLDVHSLKALGVKYFDLEDWSQEIAPYRDDFSKIPEPMLYKYLQRDLQVTWELKERQPEWLKADGVLSPLENLLCPASPVLSDMHHRGVFVDKPYLEKLTEDIQLEIIEDLEQLRTDIDKPEFNVRSNLQLCKFFFEELGLKQVNGNKLGKKEIGLLDKMYPDVKPLQQVLQLRKKMAMFSTNIMGLSEHIREDGAIHPRFLLHGTETGRLASASPNMQNIPGRIGALIRDIFRARPGMLLAELDYKQLEFRIAAHLSQDPELLSYIASGKDIHTEMACVFFKVEKPTHVQRRDAKTLVFGAAYGLHWKTVVRVYGLSPEFVQSCLGIMNDRFPVLKQYSLDVRHKAVEDGEVQSAFGRKRRFPLVTDTDELEIERQAGNHPIQSMASDICLSALIKVAKLPDVYPLLTIHDAIMCEIAEEVYDVKVKQIVDIMTTPPLELSVPLGVEVKSGTNWGSAKEYKI